VIKTRYIVLLISLMLGAALFAGGCSGGSTATAKAGDKVKIDYTLKLADGTVYDTSVGKTPFEFTLGQNQVVVGFEKAVTGMRAGESKTVAIPAAEAYGAYNSQLVRVVQRGQLPQGTEPQVGQQLQTTNSDGQPPYLRSQKSTVPE